MVLNQHNLINPAAWRCLARLVLTLLFLGGLLTPGRTAALTPAGTQINNQAVATFTWNSIPFQVTSNLVTTQVLGLYSFEITPDGTVPAPAHLVKVAAGSSVILPFILTNTGNIADSYGLGLPFVSGDILPADKFLYIDQNGNGILDPGEDTPVGGVPAVPPGGFAEILVRVDIPAAAKHGENIYLNLTGTSAGDPLLAADDNNIFQLQVTDLAALQLSKKPSVTTVSPGNQFFYTMKSVNLGGSEAHGVTVMVDGAPRVGILIQSAIPEQATGGTTFVSGSLAGAPPGYLPVYSTNGGLTWTVAEPAAAVVTNVGYLLETTILPGQEISLKFSVQVDPGRDDSPLASSGDLSYATAPGGAKIVTTATTLIQVLIPSSIKNIFIGPAGLPRAVGVSDLNGDGVVNDNDDFTLARGLNTPPPAGGRSRALPLNSEVIGNWVVFSNTVENASAAPETINVQVDASSTLPADWTVLFYQTDGLTPLLDTNGDAIHDVGILPPGGTYTVTVRIYIPLTAVPGDNGGAGYNNVVRSSLASAPGVFNLTTNIIASIVTVSQVWDPFRKDQTAPALPQTGDTISYTLEFGNQSSVSLTNVVIIDELSAELTNIRNWTDLLIADINNPLLTVPAVATYDPLPPHKMIWNIPSVPANFTGRVSFDATIANGLPPVTEILNDFVIRSDQTQEMRRSNLVFAAVGVPQVLTIQKTSNEKNAEVGDYILYTLDLANSGLTPVTAAVVTDTLPRGFRYIPGTAKMDDAPFEPAVTPDGKVLTWNVGLLPPGGTRKIKYACQITPDAMRGNGRNQAELAVTYPLGTRVSVFAENQVHVTEGPFANLSIIFGKVFLDQNDNRLQDAAEPGIGGVRLYLEDGTHVTTDREGKYHFEGVKPGMHVIRLDQTTLAPDLLPATIDSSNAANPLSRFVDLKFGTPHKANFRVLTAARQEPAETAGASGTPLRLQSPAVTGLGDGGGTRITVLADRPVRTLWVHDPGTGTVNLQFPGAELGPETAAGSREYAEDLNIEEIRLHDDREGNQAKVQIRLRKRVGGYPSVSIEEQANGLLVQVGAAADAPPALPTAAATGTEPEPVAQVQTRFLAPADGTAFISRGRVNVEVSCHLAAAFDLFVNDQLVDKAQIGRKKFRVRERRADYEYVGVALEPGANRLRFTARPPGKSADESAEITVHRSAAPASVRVTVTPEKPVADGKTEPVLAVSLLDAAGIATANGTVLTVVVDRGDILSRDLQQVEPGHQVQVRDGRALVRLSAAAQPEVRELKIIAGELEYSEKLRFHPDLRDWIVNGVVALTGQRQAATDETLNADTHRQTELDDRVAVFAKGRLPFDTLMTVSYDNTKDEDGRKLFQEDDPLKYYPIYGDETRQEYEAESRDKLYLKLERDDGFLMWGDFKTGLDQAKLTAYDRSFTGAQAQARTDWFDFDAFFSRNDQAQVKTEIQGQGISGYYNLPDRDLIENSEQVTIETRDRWHPERVLKTQSMQRYSDYSMDYDRGRLLFKRPVPSKDQNLDPVFIVVRYEVDGRKAGNYNVYGGRAAVHDPSRRFELGATSIVEQALPENYTLQGADLTLRLQPWLTLRGEYAKSRTVNGLRDDAHLVELEATHERAKFRLWHERIGKNFENLSMRGSSAGIQSFGLEGKFKLTDEWGFEDQLYSRRDTAAGTTSDVILHDVLYKQERFDLCLGGGYVHEREGLGGGTTDRRQSPILRLGGGIDLNSRWRLEAMHQHAFGDTTSEQPTRSELDVSYKINDRTKAYLGGERRKSLLGGYEDSLVIGIDRQINRSLKGFQKFTVTGAADGRRVASGSGLDLSLPINSELTLDATAELSRTVIGTRATGLGKDDFWAFTIGASYRPLGGNYTAVSRYEVRGSEDNLAHLAEIGGTLRLNPDHSLFGRNIFTYDQSRQPGTPNSWTLDLLTGWAYRPVANDRLMILSDVEVKTESGTAEADEARLQRYLFSGELHYQPAAHTWLEAKYACKLARASFARGDLFSDVKAVRLQHDLSQRLYAAAGARMLSVYESGTHDLGYGVELGLNLRKDARIAVGYNFSGFRDRDFDRNDTWERGAYISFFWKFDESLLGILRRLEGKTD